MLRDREGPDPIEAEAAPWAVRAGNLVFCSGFTASNFKTGLAAGRRPGFPNYGNDAGRAGRAFLHYAQSRARAGWHLARTRAGIRISTSRTSDVLGSRQHVDALHAGAAGARLDGHQGPASFRARASSPA